MDPAPQVKALAALYAALLALLALGEPAAHLVTQARVLFANSLFDLYGPEIQGDVLTLLRYSPERDVVDVIETVLAGVVT